MANRKKIAAPKTPVTKVAKKKPATKAKAPVKPVKVASVTRRYGQQVTLAKPAKVTSVSRNNQQVGRAKRKAADKPAVTVDTLRLNWEILGKAVEPKAEPKVEANVSGPAKAGPTMIVPIHSNSLTGYGPAYDKPVADLYAAMERDPSGSKFTLWYDPNYGEYLEITVDGFTVGVVMNGESKAGVAQTIMESKVGKRDDLVSGNTDDLCDTAKKVINVLGNIDTHLNNAFGENCATTNKVDSSVKHPKHYNAHPSGVEAIDILEHFTFNVGNAVKYLWRMGLKDYEKLNTTDAKVRELEKAREYIDFEIARVKKFEG